MLIIVEGPDNGGKSTLVERLRTSWRGKFVSMLGGRTGLPEDMRKRTYGVLNGGVEPGVLCERFHPMSDEVYRDLYGGPRVFSRHETNSIYDRLSGLGARIVYCRPPVSQALTTAVTAKGDDDPEWVERISRTLPALYAAYDRVVWHSLAWRCGVPIVHYDYTDPEVATLTEALICAD